MTTRRPKRYRHPTLSLLATHLEVEVTETLTGVDISISEQTHPVPGAMYFMVSHNNVIFRPQLSFGPDANGNQVPSGTLSVGILLADFVEAGISLKGGSTTVKYSADGQSAEETQSSRTIGIYARAHIATSDELSLEAGGGLGVGLSNYESDLSGTDESSSSTSFEAGINIKSVYHLSEHLDLIATFAFIFSRVPVVADDQQGDSDDAIAVYSYAFSPLGLRLKF